MACLGKERGVNLRLTSIKHCKYLCNISKGRDKRLQLFVRLVSAEVREALTCNLAVVLATEDGEPDSV